MLEGWFYDDGVMAEIKQLAEKSRELMKKKRHSVSRIAVFASCESLYYVNKKSALNSEVICKQRGALARMGAPSVLFSLNDLERVVPGRY